MGDFFQGLFAALGSYFQDGQTGGGLFWFIFAGPLVFVWLFVKVGLTVLEDKGFGSGRAFDIHKLFILGSCVAALVLISAAVILWQINYFSKNAIELAFMGGLLLTVAMMGFSYWRFAQNLSGPDFFRQPLTRMESDAQLVEGRNSFQRLKYSSALPLAGFAFLFLVANTPDSLVSIVIDNSSSMGESNENGMIPIETGRLVLQKAIIELKENTDLVITTFEPGSNFKPSIQEITGTTNPDNLMGINSFFSYRDLKQALSYTEDLEAQAEIGSPICETIWKNFLFNKDLVDQSDYKDVVSIVITDGREIGVSSGIDGFLCDHSLYASLFPQATDVHFVNLAGEEFGEIFSKAEACGYSIEDGSAALAYENSINKILRDFTREWFFIYWLGILYVLSVLGILLIQPKT